MEPSAPTLTDDETITLRATVIGGQTYPDDFMVIWRKLRPLMTREVSDPRKWRW
jgi:hypothetical protein